MENWEIEKLVFSHPEFQTIFQQHAKITDSVLKILVNEGFLTRQERNKLKDLPQLRKSYNIFLIMMTKRTFHLQVLMDAMKHINDNAQLLKMLQTKIEKKHASLKVYINDIKRISDKVALELLPAVIGKQDATSVVSRQTDAESMAHYVHENLSTVSKHLKTMQRNNEKDHDRVIADYESRLQHYDELLRRTQKSLDESYSLKHLSHRIAKELLPAAIGNQKASSIVLTQTDDASMVRYANENLSIVVQHLGSREDYLIKKMERERDIAIQRHEARLLQTEERVSRIGKFLEDKARKTRKRRINKSRERLRRSPETLPRFDSFYQRPEESSKDSDKTVDQLSRANSVTTIYNININENSNTGTFVLNQGQEDNST